MLRASAQRLVLAPVAVGPAHLDVVAVVGRLLGADQLAVEQPGALRGPGRSRGAASRPSAGSASSRGDRREQGRRPPAPSAPRSRYARGVRAATCASASASAGSSASILFQTSIISACASAPTPSSARMVRTFSAWISLSGWAMSRTCRIRSASSTSSSVARNAATSWCGRSEMKPTVSDRIARRPPGSSIARIVGSSVANSMSLASTSEPVSRLNSVDLPALV